MNEDEYRTYLDNVLLSGLYDNLDREDVSFMLNNYYLSGLDKIKVMESKLNKKNKKKVKVLQGIL